MRTALQLVEIIGPMLHHANTFIPIFAAGVDPAGRIGIEMCQLPFDRIRVPHSHLVEESGGRRAESMGRHLFTAVAQPPKRSADSVLRHATVGRPRGREEVFPMAGKGVKIFEHRKNLP